MSGIERHHLDAGLALFIETDGDLHGTTTDGAVLDVALTRAAITVDPERNRLAARRAGHLDLHGG
jgi:hypothetical protein